MNESMEEEQVGKPKESKGRGVWFSPRTGDDVIGLSQPITGRVRTRDPIPGVLGTPHRDKEMLSSLLWKPSASRIILLAFNVASSEFE